MTYTPSDFAVSSEIGRLRRVMLHRPGKELERLTIDNKDDLRRGGPEGTRCLCGPPQGLRCGGGLFRTLSGAGSSGCLGTYGSS